MNVMKVKGFTASAVQAGIRYKDRLDLGLIFSETPAIAAGVFTANKVKAAPVLLDIERLKQGKAQAILVNSGIANACTGEQGMEAALSVSKDLAERLEIPENMVQVASTGVIGEPLDVEPFHSSYTQLLGELSSDGFDDVSRAIMTTDTVPKTSYKTVSVNGENVSILGIAKGSGMIMPDMATMLCFVLTDAQIVFPVLKQLIKAGVDQSFNRISVDGDTSTNDMVLALANGAAENPWIDDENPEGKEAFSAALMEVLKDLALQVVADGEGATKLVTIKIKGAREADGAMDAAQTIANSALVKTAFFGEDANWGRIIAALGRSDCFFEQNKVDMYFDDVQLVRNGVAVGGDAEERGHKRMQEDHFTVTIDLNDGLECAEVYTCDLSVDYVKINADYRS